MDRLPDNLVGWALAATGALLAIAAVTAVLALSGTGASGGGATRAGVRTAHGVPASAIGAPVPGAVAAGAGLTISARRTPVGTILVGPGGEVLYAFSRDTRRHDACVMIHGCVAQWPLLRSPGRLRAGHGVSRARLSTIAVGGSRQVTYAGHPLYLFAVDAHGTDTGYVGEPGSGGTWPAVSPRGTLVR